MQFVDLTAQQKLIREKIEANIRKVLDHGKYVMGTAFSFLGYKEGDFPVSEDCSRRIFSLPMHPYLKKEDQKRIAQVLGLPQK